MIKCGVIGLGAMGAPIALNLQRAGWLGAVWNRSPARAQSVQDSTGIPIAESPADLATRCNLILVSVSRDADVAEVVRAAWPGLQPGAVVVDTSTTSSHTAQAMAESIAKRGAHFLDAPVSGGVEGARQGTLVMMVGGEESVLERVRGPLSAIAKRIVHIGPVGSGQATKAVNQLMAAGINQAVTEALAFGLALGLPMHQVVEVVSGGAAGNWFLAHRGLTMLAGRFEPGFQVALHHKDLNICQAMLQAKGFAAPSVLQRTLADYEELIREGWGEEDISALFRLKQRRYRREMP